MKPGLKYLIRTEIDEKLDSLFLESLYLFSKFDGTICPKCKIKQGCPYKGWKKYYCMHTEKKVNKKLKEKKEKITKKVASLTASQDS